MHKIIAPSLVPNAWVWEFSKIKSCHKSHTHTHILLKSCTYIHEIIRANTQAHNLAKVFILLKIKHVTKVLSLVYKK
jgi:hypothetical protein